MELEEEEEGEEEEEEGEDEDEEITNMELEVGVSTTREVGSLTFTSTESEAVFLLLGHLPGFRKDEIEVLVNETRSEISVSGEGQTESLETVEVWEQLRIRRQVETEGFYEAFQIPNGVIWEQIEATFDEEDTILIISMPKWIREEADDSEEEEITSDKDKEEVTESNYSEPLEGDTEPEAEELETPAPHSPPKSVELIELVDEDGDQLPTVTSNLNEDEEENENFTLEIPKGKLEEIPAAEVPVPDHREVEERTEEIPAVEVSTQLKPGEISHPLEPEQKLEEENPAIQMPDHLEPENRINREIPTVQIPDHLEPEENIKEDIPTVEIPNHTEEIVEEENHTVEIPHHLELDEHLEEEDFPTVETPDQSEPEEKIHEEIPEVVEAPDQAESEEKLEEEEIHRLEMPPEHEDVLEEENTTVETPNEVEPDAKPIEEIPTVEIPNQLDPEEKREEEITSVQTLEHLEHEEKLEDEEIPNVEIPNQLEPEEKRKEEITSVQALEHLEHEVKLEDEEIPTAEIPNQLEPEEKQEEEITSVQTPEHLEHKKKLEDEEIPTVEIPNQLEPEEKREEEITSVQTLEHLEHEEKLEDEEIPSENEPNELLEPEEKLEGEEIATADIPDPDQSPKLSDPIEIPAEKTPYHDQPPDVQLQPHEPEAVEDENLAAEEKLEDEEIATAEIPDSEQSPKLSDPIKIPAEKIPYHDQVPDVQLQPHEPEAVEDENLAAEEKLEDEEIATAEIPDPEQSPKLSDPIEIPAEKTPYHDQPPEVQLQPHEPEAVEDENLAAEEKLEDEEIATAEIPDPDQSPKLSNPIKIPDEKIPYHDQVPDVQLQLHEPEAAEEENLAADPPDKDPESEKESISSEAADQNLNQQDADPVGDQKEKVHETLQLRDVAEPNQNSNEEDEKSTDQVTEKREDQEQEIATAEIPDPDQSVKLSDPIEIPAEKTPYHDQASDVQLQLHEPEAAEEENLAADPPDKDPESKKEIISSEAADQNLNQQDADPVGDQKEKVHETLQLRDVAEPNENSNEEDEKSTDQVPEKREDQEQETATAEIPDPKQSPKHSDSIEIPAEKTPYHDQAPDVQLQLHEPEAAEDENLAADSLDNDPKPDKESISSTKSQAADQNLNQENSDADPIGDQEEKEHENFRLRDVAEPNQNSNKEGEKSIDEAPEKREDQEQETATAEIPDPDQSPKLSDLIEIPADKTPYHDQAPDVQLQLHEPEAVEDENLAAEKKLEDEEFATAEVPYPDQLPKLSDLIEITAEKTPYHNQAPDVQLQLHEPEAVEDENLAAEEKLEDEKFATAEIPEPDQSPKHSDPIEIPAEKTPYHGQPPDVQLQLHEPEAAEDENLAAEEKLEDEEIATAEIPDPDQSVKLSDPIEIPAEKTPYHDQASDVQLQLHEPEAVEDENHAADTPDKDPESDKENISSTKSKAADQNLNQEDADADPVGDQEEKEHESLQLRDVAKPNQNSNEEGEKFSDEVPEKREDQEQETAIADIPYPDQSPKHSDLMKIPAEKTPYHDQAPGVQLKLHEPEAVEDENFAAEEKLEDEEIATAEKPDPDQSPKLSDPIEIPAGKTPYLDQAPDVQLQLHEPEAVENENLAADTPDKDPESDKESISSTKSEAADENLNREDADADPVGDKEEKEHETLQLRDVAKPNQNSNEEGEKSTDESPEKREDQEQETVIADIPYPDQSPKFSDVIEIPAKKTPYYDQPPDVQLQPHEPEAVVDENLSAEEKLEDEEITTAADPDQPPKFSDVIEIPAKKTPYYDQPPDVQLQPHEPEAVVDENLAAEEKLEDEEITTAADPDQSPKFSDVIEIPAKKTPYYDQPPDVQLQPHEPEAVVDENLAAEEKLEDEEIATAEIPDRDQSPKLSDLIEITDEKTPYHDQLPEPEAAEDENLAADEPDNDPESDKERISSTKSVAADQNLNKEEKPEPEDTDIDVDADADPVGDQEEKEHETLQLRDVAEPNQNSDEEGEKSTNEAPEKRKDQEQETAARSMELVQSFKEDEKPTDQAEDHEEPEPPTNSTDLDENEEKEAAQYLKQKDEEDLDEEGKRGMRRGLRRTAPFPVNPSSLISGSAFIFSLVVLAFHFLRDRKRK